MPRRNTIRADDLDFEIHVDPSCLSDPMDDNENKAPEEPKVQDETTTNQETEPLNTHIDKEDHDHSTAEAKVDPTTEATGEDKSTIIEQESDQSAIPEAEAKVEPASESEHESSDSDSEIESDHEAEPQVTLEKDNEEPIQEPLVEADELASEAEIDTLAPEPSLDDTEDKDDEEEPTPVEDVTVAEDTTTEAPIEDTSSADISTQDISVPDATAEDLDDDDEPVEEDKDKSSAEFEESIADIEERQFSETESEISGSRRVSSGSSGSSYSDRQSTRSEAIQEVARDIASQIDNHEKRESLDDYSEVDDDSYISHAKTISARQSNANMAHSVKSGVDEGGENSSHHEHEDDVFSDRSPRSSVGSVSEGDHRKAQDAMHRMTRSPRVSGISGISGISGFSEYDREDEDFIPTIRGNPRPIFRSPSSVKAMQMSSPPGSTVGGSPRSGRRAPLPGSSRMSSPRFSEQYSPKRTPPRFKRSTPPLVLLHVTLLPLRWPWGEVLENADPEELSKECKTIKDAWRTLQNRMADTTVERGILLPHPQNDYEVLEERLLEALELPLRRRARILECGHYLGPSNMMTIEDSDSESDEDEDEDEEEAERRRESRRQSQPTHWCKTCKSDIHYESLGQGKIFRVKVYASNGLIRGGAWEACWKEMERVDVELEPLVDAVSHHELVQLEADQERDLAMREAEEEERYVRLEEERREFESRERGRVSTRRGEPHGPIEDLSMDESHAADITKDAAEQSRSFDDLEKDIDEHLQEERERSMAASTGARSPDTSRMDEPSISPKAEYQKRDNAPPASENHNGDAQRSFKSQHGSAKATKDSLPELLAESARVLMQDKKNILIGLLSILIVLLAIRGGPGSRQSPDAFEFIRNEEVPTVTVTQAMGLETINPIEEVTASVAAAVEEESGVESDLPEESVIVEDTPATEEEDVAGEDGAEEEQVKSVDDSSAPGAIGDAIPSLEAPSCSERIVRVVETVTSVETATVYAERPSVETQAAEAVSDEEVEEEQAENDEKVVEEQAQESVLAEAEVVSEDSKDSKDSEVAEASAEQESVEEAPPSEETILVSEEEEEEAATVEEVEEAEEADEAKESKEEQAAQVTAPPAIDSFSDLQDETPSKSAAPKAWWFGKAAPEQTAGALEEEEKHEEL